MKKFAFTNLWRINESEIFASREALELYVTENWQDYALPVGEDKEFVSLVDSEKYSNALELNYRTRDFIDDDNTLSDWVSDSVTLWLDYTQMVELYPQV